MFYARKVSAIHWIIILEHLSFSISVLVHFLFGKKSRYSVESLLSLLKCMVLIPSHRCSATWCSPPANPEIVIFILFIHVTSILWRFSYWVYKPFKFLNLVIYGSFTEIWQLMLDKEPQWCGWVKKLFRGKRWPWAILWDRPRVPSEDWQFTIRPPFLPLPLCICDESLPK